MCVVCVLCHTDGQGAELVLDHIIERKRMDDLSMSIIDGRFAEQKVSIRSFVLDIPTSFC